MDWRRLAQNPNPWKTGEQRRPTKDARPIGTTANSTLKVQSSFLLDWSRLAQNPNPWGTQRYVVNDAHSTETTGSNPLEVGSSLVVDWRRLAQNTNPWATNPSGRPRSTVKDAHPVDTNFVIDWRRLAQHPNPWGSTRVNPVVDQRSVSQYKITNPTHARHSLYPKGDSRSLELEEAALERQLRSICTRFGKERRKTLGKSATILLELGRVYLQKSKEGGGMEQKLNYIRSCTLIFAAIVRYKFLGSKQDKLRESETLCRELSRELLRSSGSKFSLNLFDFSVYIHGEVGVMREQVKTSISHSLRRPKESLGEAAPWVRELRKRQKNHLPSNEEIELMLSRGVKEEERRITLNVMELNKTMTDQYKTIMRKIADKCLNLLGPPPCKFSVVGLGSLARGEVTLYSDFEHVIVLEEDSKLSGKISLILEYFRWFSVLHQIFVIGFGETIIPSVQVKSLNDAYSGDSDKNWFFDCYTPRGIAFDGMLPHSCNTPLGRQQPTEKRPHVVELIQTPENMAKYLTHEECLKNGYYLEDVLKSTCLVYGDRKTYERFLAERQAILEVQTAKHAEEYDRKIVHNANNFVREGNFDMMNTAEFDSKNTFYRPLATSLAFLGKIYGLTIASTFQIIEKLLQRNAIDQNLYYTLSYAFAVACELRVKLYGSINQQRHQVNFAKIRELVGEDGACACKDMIRYLRDSAKAHIIAAENEDNRFLVLFLKDTINAPPLSRLVSSLTLRGFFEDAVRVYEETGLSVNPHHEYGWMIEYQILHCYHEVGYVSNRRQAWCQAEKTYKRLLKYEDMPDHIIIELYLTMAIIFKGTLNRDSESMALFQNYFELNRVLESKGCRTHREFTLAFTDYQDLVFNKMGTKNAKRHLENGLWKGPINQDCHVLKRLFMVRNRMWTLNPFLWMVANLRVELLSIINDIVRNSTMLEMPRKLLKDTALLQLRLHFFSDAVKTIELFAQVPKPHSSLQELVFIDKESLDVVKFLCLCRLGRYTDAIPGSVKSKSSRGYEKEKLLRFLVTMLWRKLNSSWRFCPKKELSIILCWIVNLKVTKKQKIIFGVGPGSGHIALPLYVLWTAFALEIFSKPLHENIPGSILGVASLLVAGLHPVECRNLVLTNIV